jgi:hypothetical protein
MDARHHLDVSKASLNVSKEGFGGGNRLWWDVGRVVGCRSRMAGSRTLGGMSDAYGGIPDAWRDVGRLWRDLGRCGKHKGSEYPSKGKSPNGCAPALASPSPHPRLILASSSPRPHFTTTSPHLTPTSPLNVWLHPPESGFSKNPSPYPCFVEKIRTLAMPFFKS